MRRRVGREGSTRTGECRSLSRIRLDYMGGYEIYASGIPEVLQGLN
jgi:hypothetical protein